MYIKIKTLTCLCLFTVFFWACESDKIKLETEDEDPVENLTFNKQTKEFSSGGRFTTADILAGIVGKKENYTLKNITNVSPNDVVSLSGTKPNFSLEFLKEGNFTATIILEHPSKKEATIENAQFEITSGSKNNPYGLPIKNFHVPGLFILDLGSGLGEYYINFIADKGANIKRVYKKINKIELNYVDFNLLMAHKNGFVLGGSDTRLSNTGGFIEITDKHFKRLKRIALSGNGSAISGQYSATIINQKLYHTNKVISEQTGHTYIVDLDTQSVQTFNDNNTLKFMRDGVGNLYYWTFDTKLYKVKDKNNLDKGGHLIKHFNIDKTKKGFHDKEGATDVTVDNSGKFWMIKEVMKKMALVFWHPSTYEYHLITKDLNTGVEKTLNTKITGVAARFIENKYTGKRYFVYVNDDKIHIQEILVSATNDVTLGRVVKIIKSTKNYNFLFTKNGFVFIQNGGELLKGKSDFSNLKKIADVGHTVHLVYSAP